jgi:non-ribosomal peptide synthetase component F
MAVISSDDSKLVPRGCIGELLLDGPLVAAGYLGEPAITATAFVNDLAWLLKDPTNPCAGSRSNRLYKTGDLARYNTDGTLEFSRSERNSDQAARPAHRIGRHRAPHQSMSGAQGRY